MGGIWGGYVLPLVPSVNGIAFPATQVPDAGANVLDDYEEGTWTPAITFGGAAVGVTYAATNAGYYTKVGRVVCVTGMLELTSKGTSVGVALLQGLPFIVANKTGNYPAACLNFYNITFANQFEAFGALNGSYIFLMEITEAAVRTQLANTDFANDSFISIMFCYETS